MPAITPLTALSMSASSNTMTGDLPPSSSDTSAKFSAELRMMCRADRAAGEADALHQRMRGQHATARFAMAGHDVDDARREARLLDQLGEFEHGSRGMFGGLQHHGVAGRERRADLHRDEEELRIPRHDGGNDAQRLAHRQGEHVRLVDGQRTPITLSAAPASKLKKSAMYFACQRVSLSILPVSIVSVRPSSSELFARRSASWRRYLPRAVGSARDHSPR